MREVQPHRRISLLAQALTDNRTCTVAEVRSIFTKAGGSLRGPTGGLDVRALRADLHRTTEEG